MRRSIPLRAVDYFSHFFEKPWRELFDGRLIPVTDMPRSYVPTLIALKLPELMLALGICGTVAGHRRSGATRLRHPRPPRWATPILLAAILPILVTVARGRTIYNGIRHFVFTMPPFAVLGGLAAAWIAGGCDTTAPSPSRQAASHALPELPPRSSRWCGCILTSTRITIISPAAFAAPNRTSCWIIGDCR